MNQKNTVLRNEFKFQKFCSQNIVIVAERGQMRIFWWFVWWSDYVA